MEVKGSHVLAELSKCEAIHLYDDEMALSLLLTDCAKAAGATILSVRTHKFEPQGISGIVFLAESHIGVHVFPEEGYISFDCFTCGTSTDPWLALELFVEKTKPLFHATTEVNRGIPHPIVQGAYTHETEELGFSASYILQSRDN